MSPRLRAALAAIPAVAGAAAALALDGHPTAGRAAVVVTGAYAVIVLLAALRGALRTPARPRPLIEGETVRPLAQLTSLQTSVELAQSSAIEYEYRLRRTLRRDASERLRLRRGIDIDGRPDAAREVLGEHAWQMLIERSADDRRTQPAHTLTDIAAVIETIEGL